MSAPLFGDIVVGDRDPKSGSNAMIALRDNLLGAPLMGKDTNMYLIEILIE